LVFQIDIFDFVIVVTIGGWVVVVDVAHFVFVFNDGVVNVGVGSLFVEGIGLQVVVFAGVVLVAAADLEFIGEVHIARRVQLFGADVRQHGIVPALQHVDVRQLRQFDPIVVRPVFFAVVVVFEHSPVLPLLFGNFFLSIESILLFTR